MKNILIAAMTIFHGCSWKISPEQKILAENKKNEEYVLKIQKALLKSKITIDQCRIIESEMQVSLDICKLVLLDYESYIKKSVSILYKYPPYHQMDQKQKDRAIKNTANFLRQFPNTTEKEVLDSLIK